MLSQTSEHALRAVLYLARQPDESPVPAEVIARALGAPPKYLAKTLNVLAKRGILVSLRGPTGGFRLGMSAESLPLARIIEPFDEPRSNGTCLLGGRACDAAAPCASHAHWKAIGEQVWSPLENSTIAELLGDAHPNSEVAGKSPGISRSGQIEAGATSSTGA